MAIAIENRYLPPLIPFLENMPLAGAQSRARSKLLGMVTLAFQGLALAERELVTEYATCDENGQPIIGEDSTFTLQNPESADAYVAAREELMSERTILTGDTYEGHYLALQTLLTEYAEPLTGDDASVYDHLCDAIDQAVSEKP
ncbi:DUF1617 family protein [Trueperella pyogenes]|uniref:DUF1617 family protein n=1 Tax=Trueperella pyogenes TaxID=1661 RepID=UPI00345D71C3